ncbi:MAG: 2-succinyl-5-enolpyruvyl-6-hydroxy-3-cyclohexene-1-carboxylic-acid synthase [Calditrichaeota bacterium]|nr:MAG: 2-succinyl-5-enolpyruvyl-6-hydroxy-3-cyclohexene-1-carboxylic-acid synthase [Calditrichota bacterium]
MTPPVFPENINHLWAAVCVEECVRQGITAFCIAPGSRSTPLTTAAARHPSADVRILIDERGAAFHALGYARASGRPAVLICSSGTAAANFYPAVIEASQENVPMLIFSADRPPELRDTGANQTIDQVGLFGGYAREFYDIPPPSESVPLRWLLRTLAQGIHRSREPHRGGPVHFNFMFREPLAPTVEPIAGAIQKEARAYFSRQRPALETPYPIQILPDAILDEIGNLQDVCIIAGRLSSKKEAQAVRRLADHLGAPLITDITSGLRLDKSERVLPYADLMLLHPDFRSFLHSRPILHFGGQWVSKRLLQTLETHEGPYYNLTPFDRVTDPAMQQTTRIVTDVTAACDQLMAHIPSGSSGLPENIVRLHAQIHTLWSEYRTADDPLDELYIARTLARHAENALFIASSMPIRDMDMAAEAGRGYLPVGANRGASGIDGTIASALGFSRGLEKPLTLLIGDLAFLHDMNSLMQLKAHNRPVTIVLVNNHGGAIFHHLPIAGFDDLLVPWFTTPHEYDFEATARQFGLDYQRIESPVSLEKALKQKADRHRLLEVLVDAEYNVRQHRRLYERIRGL